MLVKLALKAGEAQRLSLGWGSYWEPFVIGFDGQVVHQVERQQQLREGVTVPLPDGRALHAQLVPTLLNRELEVQCDGETLPDSPFHAVRRLERTGILFIALGLLGVLSGGGILALLIALLGCSIYRRNRVAPWFAFVILVLDRPHSPEGAFLWLFLLYLLVRAAHAARVLEDREKPGPRTATPT